MKIIILTILILVPFINLKTQTYRNLRSDQQKIGVKSNLIYDATTSINLGVEIKVSPKLTFDLSGNYNPWSFSDNKKFKHMLIQPELRFWPKQSFNGHFIGGHLLYSYYNIGNIKLPLNIMPSLGKYRYQGSLYGAGISYGHQWQFNPKIDFETKQGSGHISAKVNIEVTIGFGYLKASYDKYDCPTCGSFIEKVSENYWGPTKLGVSIIYMLNQ